MVTHVGKVARAHGAHLHVARARASRLVEELLDCVDEQLVFRGHPSVMPFFCWLGDWLLSWFLKDLVGLVVGFFFGKSIGGQTKP